MTLCLGTQAVKTSDVHVHNTVHNTLGWTSPKLLALLKATTSPLFFGHKEPNVPPLQALGAEGPAVYSSGLRTMRGPADCSQLLR